MGTFRRVEAEKAGPDALGILIPPAKRTFVILRPRTLPWDAVLCRSLDDLRFADLAHDEASAIAQALFRSLRSGARVELLDEGHLVVRTGGHVLLICERLPGKPYEALRPAHEAIAPWSEVLQPQTEQEVYFNTRFFER